MSDTMTKTDADGLCAGRKPASTHSHGHYGVCGECGQDGLEVTKFGDFRWAHLPLTTDTEGGSDE